MFDWVYIFMNYRHFTYGVGEREAAGPLAKGSSVVKVGEMSHPRCLISRTVFCPPGFKNGLIITILNNNKCCLELWLQTRFHFSDMYFSVLRNIKDGGKSKLTAAHWMLLCLMWVPERYKLCSWHQDIALCSRWKWAFAQSTDRSVNGTGQTTIKSVRATCERWAGNAGLWA